MPQDCVYLVVRKSSGQWQFPQAAHAPGESVRQARGSPGRRRTLRAFAACTLHAKTRHALCQVAERALAQTAAGLDVHFLGNAPAAHLATAKETVFFMRASYLGGSPRPSSSGAFTGAPLPCYCLPAGRRLCMRSRARCTDWAWVTKGELTEYVGKDVHALLAQAL